MAAGDFYFAINATFRFLHQRFGEEGLVRYWRTLGKNYYRDLILRFGVEGIPAVERYWRDFFSHEPGGQVEVSRHGDRVEIEVIVCPAIKWLRDNDREVMPLYCDHCHHVSTAIAEEAGLAFHLKGGGGSCSQTFRPRRPEE